LAPLAGDVFAIDGVTAESAETTPGGSAAVSNPFATPNPEPTEAEIEAAIVQAVMRGFGEVASTLAAILERRRRARNPNVIPFRRPP
jgi:hypothetical protein